MEKQKGISFLLKIVIIFSLVIIIGGVITWQLWLKRKPSSTTPEPYIEVISPNGGEEWVEGETYTIMWKNSSDITKVDIYLQAMDQHPKGAKPSTIKVIAENVTADGSYTWTSAEPVGSCFYIFIKTSPSGGPQVSDISDNCFAILEKDETADWKIYRSDEYGFEIKYPQKWQKQIYGPFVESNPMLQQISFYGVEQMNDFTIEIWKPSTKDSQIVTNSMPGFQLKKENNLLIGGHPAKELVYYGPSNILGGMHIYRLYIVRTDDYVYAMHGGRCIDENYQICKQILSTFEFINKERN